MNIFKLQIRVLQALSPATLFQKIGLLDWYSDTLQKWINWHTTDTGLRVLDLGCATGYLSEHLYRNGCDVSGVDVSDDMIRKAKKGNASIDFRVGDARDIPFADETFDVVSSASLVNVVPEPGKVVEQMVRVCKRGGWVTFLFPADGFEDDDLRQCIARLGISGFSEAALTAWHEYAPKLGVDAAEGLLKSNGLSPGETKSYLNGMVASVSARKP